MRIKVSTFWVHSKSIENFGEYVNQILQEKPNMNFIGYEKFLEKATEKIYY